MWKDPSKGQETEENQLDVGTDGGHFQVKKKTKQVRKNWNSLIISESCWKTKNSTTTISVEAVKMETDTEQQKRENWAMKAKF